MSYDYIVNECVDNILKYIEESDKEKYTYHNKIFDLRRIVGNAIEEAIKVVISEE